MKALQILKKVYDKVQTLDEFIKERISEECYQKLVQPSDSKSYTSLVTKSLVCTESCTSDRKRMFPCVQLSEMKDIIMHVLKVLKKGKKKNLLTFGIQELSPYCTSQMALGLQYMYPNYHITRLCQQQWTLLLERIGDDLLIHLLVTRSVFLQVKNGCYIQATGCPIYELWQYPETIILDPVAKPNRTVDAAFKRQSRRRRPRSSNAKRFPRLPSIQDLLLEDEDSNRNLLAGQRSWSCGTKRSLEDAIANQSDGDGLCVKKRHRALDHGCISTSQKQSVDMSESFQCHVVHGQMENGLNAPQGNLATDTRPYSCCDDTDFQNVAGLDGAPAASVGSSNHGSGPTSLLNETGSIEELPWQGCVRDSDPELTDVSRYRVTGHMTNWAAGDANDREPGASSRQPDGDKGLDFANSQISGQISSETAQNNDRSGLLKGQDTALGSAVSSQDKTVAVSSTQAGYPERVKGTSLKTEDMQTSVKVTKRRETPKQLSLDAIFSKPVIYYAKDMRERFPFGRLSKLSEHGGKGLTADVFSLVLTGIVRCNCQMKSDISFISGSGETCLPDTSTQQLEVLLLRLVNRIRSLQKFGSDVLDKITAAGERSIKPQAPTDTAPDPSSSVLTRGSHQLQTYSTDDTTSAVQGGQWQPETSSNVKDDRKISFLLEQYIPQSKVKQFVKIVLNRILPISLLGKKNTKIFVKAVQKSTSLGRYEKFYVGSIIKGLKSRDVSWLADVIEEVQPFYVAQLAAWLVTHIVMPLLKGYFYITESTAHRNRIFYYRKKTWKVIQRKAIKELLEKGHLQEITEDDVRDMITSEKSLGVARLRFLPTTTSVRAIVNLAVRQPSRQASHLSVNYHLQTLRAVLTLIKTKTAVGSSQFGLDDIYKTWRRFVLRRQRTNDNRRLYFTMVDIKSCFDSIDQTKLFNIMKGVLNQVSVEDFVLRRYCMVLSSTGEVKKKFKKEVSPLADFVPNFTLFVCRRIRESQLKDVIFVDQVQHSHRDLSALCRQLEAHLFGGIVKIEGTHYRQTRGIFQGSTLSTILCNYYYGCMECEHLHFLADELLMRQVDDFLFVTPYQHNAKRFLDTMTAGIPDYNCTVNRWKSLTNVVSDGHEAWSIPREDYFPWCGMLFHMDTLEVRVDYTRYHGVAIKDAMTLDLYHRPKGSLVRKIISSLRLKCHGMFFDHEINSLPVLVKNAFYMLVLTAYKFHCYVRRLLSHSAIRHDVGFFIAVIRSLPGYCVAYMRKKTTVQAGSSPLSETVLRWICYKAFMVKLQQHRSVYKQVLTWLRREIDRLNKMVQIPPQIVPSEVPGVFGTISC